MKNLRAFTGSVTMGLVLDCRGEVGKTITSGHRKTCKHCFPRQTDRILVSKQVIDSCLYVFFLERRERSINSVLEPPLNIPEGDTPVQPKAHFKIFTVSIIDVG